MQRQSFNHEWRFYLGDPIDQMTGKAVPTEDWRLLDLPHDWSIETDRCPDNPGGPSNGWFGMGLGFYRKTFVAPETWRGKKVLIEFEGVYMNADTWLNEDFLGSHPYGYTTFTYDLTNSLRYGEENMLQVRVNNAGQVNSRWYSGSGIYRPAWLIVNEPIHIAHWGVSITTPEVSPEKATLRIETKTLNERQSLIDAALHTRVLAPDGETIAEAETRVSIAAQAERVFIQNFVVEHPALWSPETPSLYRVETELVTGGQVVDSETNSFGIRSLAWNAEQGFLLNGQAIKLKGGCVHHDNGVLGSTSLPRAEEKKVERLKASGFNAIRCAHNPPAPAFLDACDRLGMLVIDETFDCWREGKNLFDYHMFFEAWWQRDTESMVLRDRNHPSVVIWSIGNEVLERDGRSNGVAVARMQAECVRSLDATRPITAAICGIWGETRKTWIDTDGVFAVLDVGGYNYQWQQYRPDHKRHPERLMMGTESFPMEAYDNWMSVQELPYVIGDFVWTSNDYLGESGIGRSYLEGEEIGFLGRYPWHQAYCGDIDLAGFKRPQSYYRDVLWGNGEPLYIAVHVPIPEGKVEKVSLWGWPDVWNSWTWPGQEGQLLQVQVYSAFERVELFLNGRSLGVKMLTPADKLIATFEVPYEPGELKVVGYRGEQVAGQAVLHTTGPAAAIRLTPDRSILKAEGEDLAYVTVEVVDEAGRMVPSAMDTLYFTVRGAGEIAAVGNGNPTSTERYRGNQRQVFHGRCLVVVRSKGPAGEIRLNAQADGLEGAEAVLSTE